MKLFGELDGFPGILRHLAMVALFVPFMSNLPANAEPTPVFGWAARGGGEADDLAWGIASDAAGNTYLTGRIDSTNADFGGLTITKPAGNAMFLAKYDPLGNPLWVRLMEQSSGSLGNDVALDSAGNVYVAGAFNAPATFAGLTLTGDGSMDLFVLKCDSDGNGLWATVGGGSGDDMAWSIAVDAATNICLGGFFSATATFGTNTLVSHGARDILVARLDSSGHFLWAQGAGSTRDFEQAYGVAADGSGNVYATGNFYSGATFGTTNLGGGSGSHMFTAKYGPDGTLLWVRQSARPPAPLDWGTTYGRSIAVDGSNNVVVTGYFVAYVTLGNTNLESGQYGDYFDSRDTFLVKFDPDGNWLWVKQPAWRYDDEGRDLVVDARNNIYVAGRYYYELHLGDIGLIGRGDQDTFVAKFDPAGDVIWAVSGGGVGTDFQTSIVLDPQDRPLITGQFANTAYFGSQVLVSRGGPDIYVARLDPPPPTLSVALAAGGIVLSWPTNAVGFLAESVTAPGTISWSPVTNVPTIVGDQNVITLAPNASSQWFRLRKP